MRQGLHCFHCAFCSLTFTFDGDALSHRRFRYKNTNKLSIRMVFDRLVACAECIFLPLTHNNIESKFISTNFLSYACLPFPICKHTIAHCSLPAKPYTNEINDTMKKMDNMKGSAHKCSDQHRNF